MHAVFSREEIKYNEVGLKIDGSELSNVVKPSEDVEEDQVIVLGDLMKATTFFVLVELVNACIKD
jgi:hypothetical protein